MALTVIRSCLLYIALLVELRDTEPHQLRQRHTTTRSKPYALLADITFIGRESMQICTIAMSTTL